MAGVVRRKFLLRIKIHPGEIADRIAILRTVEAPHRHATRIGHRRIEFEDLTLYPRGQLLRLRWGQVRLIGRRHDLGPDVVQRPQPEFVILQLRRRGELIERHAALGHPGPMAVIAILVQHRLNLALERRQSILGRKRRRRQQPREN